MNPFLSLLLIGTALLGTASAESPNQTTSPGESSQVPKFVPAETKAPVNWSGIYLSPGDASRLCAHLAAKLYPQPLKTSELISAQIYLGEYAPSQLAEGLEAYAKHAIRLDALALAKVLHLRPAERVAFNLNANWLDHDRYHEGLVDVLADFTNLTFKQAVDFAHLKSFYDVLYMDPDDHLDEADLTIPEFVEVVRLPVNKPAYVCKFSHVEFWPAGSKVLSAEDLPDNI